MSEPQFPPTETAFRRAVLIVAVLNFVYFCIESGVALAIGSVSLFADAIDFFEDAAVNTLIVFALGWSPARRTQVSILLAAVLFFPGIATLWTAWEKFLSPIPPAAIPLSLTGLGALAVNLYCAGLLVRFRAHSGSLAKAAFLSARNDALANIAIVLAGLITRVIPSAWPDLLVGIGIFFMNLDAAREILSAARQERAIHAAQP